jgi:dolichyl-phosphate beta-glucosyltransferase
MTSPPAELSIIIPAFNEERGLPQTVESIRGYLAARPVRAEVIIVDDGSTDRTAALVNDYHKRYPFVRLVSNGRNRGKGFSVCHGMREARGEFALFTDADLSAPIEEADKLLEALRNGGYDVAIGSRALDRRLIQVHQSAGREYAGIIFNFLVRSTTGLPFADTQCGFKAFRRERARIIFEQQRSEGFGFDPEILFLAQRHGLVVKEIPVRWSNDPASKVRLTRDSIRMVADLLTTRWNAWMGRYPVNATREFACRHGDEVVSPTEGGGRRHDDA